MPRQEIVMYLGELRDQIIKHRDVDQEEGQNCIKENEDGKNPISNVLTTLPLSLNVCQYSMQGWRRSRLM